MAIGKIAIISEFNIDNINYGNRLQAFALNRFLVKSYSKCKIEYLYFNFSSKNLRTKKRNLIEQSEFICKFFYKKIFIKKLYSGSERRKEKFQRFSERNMSLIESAYSWDDLEKHDFDAIIVGSDIVWVQFKNFINRLKFLDFASNTSFSRIAYAASFGRDWIPKENILEMKRCLEKYKAISVREASSVKLLKDIGINAVHTLDPTLLLDVSEYEDLEEQPCEILEVDLEKDRYIFTYLLGTDSKMREQITRWAHKRGFLIVTIPFASGWDNKVDSSYGDIRVNDCSPENFLWLVHYAEYIITDSFHATAFSTIFRKKFVVLERKTRIDINNRMIDFLRTIEQTDKKISSLELEKIDNMKWDYEQIYELLNEKKKFSEEFLKEALT